MFYSFYPIQDDLPVEKSLLMYQIQSLSRHRFKPFYFPEQETKGL